MGASASTLYLEIMGGQGRRSLTLKAGEKVVIGRGGQSTLVVPNKSISLEHLEIAWDGGEVSIRDMGSSNGTFRMPQDSPFVEARFPLAYQPLDLRLGTESLTLLWSTGDEKTMARTAVIEATQARTRLTELTRPSAKAEAEVPPEPAREPEPVSTPGAAEASSMPIEEPPLPPPLLVEAEAPSFGTPARGAFRWQAFAAAFVAPLVVAFAAAGLAWRFGFETFWSAPRLVLREGAAKDFVILWVDGSVQAWAALTLLALALLAFFLTWDRRIADPWRARWPLRIAIVGFAWCWPVLWTMGTGFFSFLPTALSFRATLPMEREASSFSSPELVAQGTWLRDRREILKGSGLAYKAIFDRQWQRVVRECDGVGEDRKWDRKRVCLVLLSAVAIESLDEFQPALLMDAAERATLLTALDGLTRVVQMEGARSPFADFFLNSLRSTGLETERADLEALLQDERRSPESLRRVLFDLRRQVDRQLTEAQIERALPLALRLRVPGPLESGI